MKLTITVFGKPLMAIDVTQSQTRSSTEPAAKPEPQPFGFWGGKSGQLAERAPKRTAPRRPRTPDRPAVATSEAEEATR